MKSWIDDVASERLAANYRTLTLASGEETDVLAVVKADAYGHGAEACAVTLAQAGARWFGVADAKEGTWVRVALQNAGFDTTEILVMCGFLRESVAVFAAEKLTPVVWNVEQVEWLAGSGVPVHVEIETGMGRQGVKPGAALDAVLDAAKRTGIAVDGVMTHFSAAEVADGVATRAQREVFEKAVAQVHAASPASLRDTAHPGSLRWVHAGSSSSLDHPVGDPRWLSDLSATVGARAMVRCGIALYGYCLPIAGDGESKVRSDLQPVMTWKTRVIDVRDVAAGETIGYNALYRAPHAMRVALLPVGYSDGLRRELSSTNQRAGGWVMVRASDGIERRANILGRVSMNLTVVDVTEIDGVQVGDEVVLLGDGVTADDHAQVAGTISYEILCGVRTG